MAGGLDGAVGHHVAGGGKSDRARLVHRGLRVVVEDASAEKLQKLYEQLLQGHAMDCLDALVAVLIEAQDVDAGRLRDLAEWLAREAPDREPVKFAVALLGITGGREQRDLLMTLGRHEEMTLYVAVAISNIFGDEAEPLLFELAHEVEGWGRIHIVERLAETGDPAVKAWLVRHGYRNAIMFEYLAYTCADAGELLRELEVEPVTPRSCGGRATSSRR